MSVISAIKAMLNSQSQQVSGGSSAIQAGNNVSITNHGLSYEDARTVALDVVKASLSELAGIARETATRRAEEITEEFLINLQKEYPEGLNKANDPDFQFALLTVQREFARTGDKNLGDLLVDLLVDRSKTEQRDIMQIVLNESLGTAPKLTNSQLAAVAVVFLFRHTQNFGIGTHQLLGEYFDKHVEPFASNLQKTTAGYQHLEFSRCASISLGKDDLDHILGRTYQGQFLKGFEAKEVTDRDISVGLDGRFFMPCLNAPSLYQVRANNKELLEKWLETHKAPAEDRSKIIELFDVNKMSHEEIKATCIEIRPYMAGVFDTWNNSALGRLTLTSVGIAIGHANIKRMVGGFTDLSEWIN